MLYRAHITIDNNNAATRMPIRLIFRIDNEFTKIKSVRY